MKTVRCVEGGSVFEIDLNPDHINYFEWRILSLLTNYFADLDSSADIDSIAAALTEDGIPSKQLMDDVRSALSSLLDINCIKDIGGDGYSITELGTIEMVRILNSRRFVDSTNLSTD